MDAAGGEPSVASLHAHGHPGVTVDEVQAATGFELAVPDDVPTTRLPTPDEIDLIDTVIDRSGQRFTEVPRGT